MEAKFRDLPNLGIVELKLNESIVNYLWDLVDEAKKNNISVNKNLAGNITSSLKLKDKDNIVFPVCSQLIKSYLKKYGIPVHYLKSGDFNNKFYLDSLWVNFQYENEFNPIHTHSGAFSFVIWMKIPTNNSEQSELPIAKNSGNNLKISNFSFAYTNIIGQIREQIYPMNEEMEGVLVMFPSRLVHQVYPFYNNSNERISISGNLSFSQD